MEYTQYDVVCFGTPMVEIMRKEKEAPLCKLADFDGPYPSGDTAIMIDAAARMGAKTAFFGVVGDDEFGLCVSERLERDGVDIRGIRRMPFETTGIAFVAYYNDGSRKFIFTTPQSAARLLCIDDIRPDVLNRTRWLHISGFPLSISESIRQTVEQALTIIGPDVKVSFDPNLRPEVMKGGEVRRVCDKVLERCDLFLPSAGEASFFTGKGSDEEGCAYLARQGKLVALKKGKDGCVIYRANEKLVVPSYPAEEIDPTGAGDAFCGALIAALSEGRDLFDAGRFANALGALSVRKKGPMDGIVTREEVDAFLLSAK